MKPIRLPEPPGSPQPMSGLADVFDGDVNGVIRRAVIIGNGYPASENQSVGLVRALGLSENQTLYRVTRPKGGINEWLHWLPVAVHKKLYYIFSQIYGYSQIFIARRGTKQAPFPRENGVGVGLSVVLEADVKNIVKLAKETFEKDGPLLVVASGRDTISAASSIKRLASDNVFVVQIQHPRSRLDRFDMVITPMHDYYPFTPEAQRQVPRLFRKWITPDEPPNERVVLTVGALHHVDSAALRSAAIAWHDEFAPLPKPLLVVNIGGPTRYCRYSTDLAKQLSASLHNVLTSCGSVRISFSRRTPEKICNTIIKEVGTVTKIHIWDGEGQNPHMGHLAWADAFVVTADSVSMLSEACSTGKPVYVIGAERCTWKFVDFHKKLRERGLVRPFTGLEDMSESWSYPPLTDTSEAANQVRKALAERGWRLRP
ncbi:Mitochondrial fission protein ELM1 [Striga hermonthica]|uniref:Mitochondrial fission protein ELM1 n=1 Tax=Striga hermonthica TaxID=68872 RepID=A0A9N7RG72_STRHE|nr:Mitochondrial fission protein ELM1 [Striga hermonthica]